MNVFNIDFLEYIYATTSKLNKFVFISVYMSNVPPLLPINPISLKLYKIYVPITTDILRSFNNLREIQLQLYCFIKKSAHEYSG